MSYLIFYLSKSDVFVHLLNIRLNKLMKQKFPHGQLKSKRSYHLQRDKSQSIQRQFRDSKKHQRKKFHSLIINQKNQDLPKLQSNKIYQSCVLSDFENKLLSQLSHVENQKKTKRQKLSQKITQSINYQQRKSQQIKTQLQSLKYRLKTLNLERQSQSIKKEVLLKLKTQQINNKQLKLPPSLNYPPPLPYFYSPHQYRNPYSRNYLEQYNDQQSEQAHEQTNHFRSGQVSRTKDGVKNNNFKKRVKQFKRFHNKKTVRRRLKKAFITVYFYFCLQKFYLKIIKQRKKFFISYWPQQFLKSQKYFEQYFFSRFSAFFKILKQTENSNILPLDDDTDDLIRQKKNTVKKILNIFFECLKGLKSINNLGKVAWSFCRHGCFAQKGVLTINELDFVCFNSKHGYLRMNKSLQKSQIVSFILIKHLLFKFSLHPWQKWLKQFNPSIHSLLANNLKVIGSIIYQLFVGIQDMYLNQVDEDVYPIGNYKDCINFKNEIKLQCSPPLLYETLKRQNQLISGLFSQQYLKKHHISMKKLRVIFQNLIIPVVEQIHTMSCKYHQEFRDKVNGKTQKISYQY